jgi:hypothetical protein
MHQRRVRLCMQRGDGPRWRMSAKSRAQSWAHLWSHPRTFVYVHLYSINAAMRVTDVSDIRRTIIPSPENRKVDGSVLHLTTTLNSVNAIVLPLTHHPPSRHD